MESILTQQTTLEQLLTVIADLKAELGAIKKQLQPQASKTWLTREEAAEKLKINKSTLFNWTKKKILKQYGIEGRIYYINEEIDQALIKLN